MKYVVSRVETEGVWNKSTDCCGNVPVPTELIVLAVTRILTRSWTLDDCQEQTLISTRTIQAFMSAFVDWMSTVVYNEFVKMPEVDEVNSNGHEYGLAGLPGTIFSMDCVHIRMWGLFASLKVLFTGKEKFPSRVYEVCVNHRRLILNVTVGFPGALNDIQVSSFDPANNAVRRGKYKNYSCMIYGSDGQKSVRITDVHILLDNGYVKSGHMMHPLKNNNTYVKKIWSEMVESMRKDVECTFGIIKQMFAILKYGYRGHSHTTLDKIFLTCCTIYNQKLLWKYGNEPWSSVDEDIRTISRASDKLLDGDGSETTPAIFARLQAARDEFNEAGIEMSGMGPGDVAIQVHPSNFTEEIMVNNTNYEERRDALLVHFEQMILKNELVWPRQFSPNYRYNIERSYTGQIR